MKNPLRTLDELVLAQFEKLTQAEALAGAARYANAAAAVAISRPGTFSAIPTKEEIERAWKGYPE